MESNEPEVVGGPAAQALAHWFQQAMAESGSPDMVVVETDKDGNEVSRVTLKNAKLLKVEVGDQSGPVETVMTLKYDKVVDEKCPKCGGKRLLLGKGGMHLRHCQDCEHAWDCGHQWGGPGPAPERKCLSCRKPAGRVEPYAATVCKDCRCGSCIGGSGRILGTTCPGCAGSGLAPGRAENNDE